MNILKRVVRIANVILSYFIAVLRLLFWVALLFIYGLHKTLFMRVEVCSIELRTCPLRCDIEDMHDNLSYIEKLAIENPELAEVEPLYGMDDKESSDGDDDDFGDDGDQFPRD